MSASKPDSEESKTVVNMRFDSALLARIDAAAKRILITEALNRQVARAPRAQSPILPDHGAIRPLRER